MTNDEIEARMLEVTGKPETPCVCFEELAVLMERYIKGADEQMGDEDNPRRFVRVPVETWLSLIGNFITAVLAEAMARQHDAVVVPTDHRIKH